MSQSEEMFGALRLLGKTVELVRFPEESHDLSRGGRPDRRVERLRRIAGWYERFLGTAAADRPAKEEETQVLVAPADAAHEWAKTLVMSPQAEFAEPSTVQAPAAEPEVVQPTVPEFATAEAPIVEPEALPNLPAPVEAVASMALSANAGPPSVAESVPLEATLSGPSPQVAELGPRLEVIYEPVMEMDAEPEPGSAMVEPLAPVVPDAAAAASEAPAQPAALEPATPEPAPPAPVAAPDQLPQPVGQAAVDLSATLVSWPARRAQEAPTNGALPTPATFEEATSSIPVWQPTDSNAEPAKGTVSLQAMPPEQVASGSGFGALLTFESGPFAGRIVALPTQMVSIGRAPDNDVVVGDPATSGHHGKIDVRQGYFWISDLGSTNGTMVNGEPVIEKQLSDGDMIAIGQNTLRFSLES